MFVVYRSPHYACPEVIRVSFVLLICAELKIIILAIFGQPFVKLFALCYQTILCPICLSVTLVYCGQTVGWIKMKLGMQVGLGPGHIVLDGAQLPCPQKGTQPPIFYFQPMSIVAKRLPISATAEHLFIIVGDVK